MENNIMMSEVPTNPVPAQAPTQDVPIEIQLVNTPITDETSALNVLVGFIALAQKRGTFNIQESAKIWDCIKQFNPQAK
jgi:hypothetical protein